MNVSPNIRPSCIGSIPDDVLFIGGIGNGPCYQQSIYNSSGSIYKIWQNVTTVKNYNYTVGGCIAPYSRTPYTYPGDCSPANPTCCGDYSTHNCACCGPPTSSETCACVISPSSSIVYNGTFWNCFTQSNQTASNICQTIPYGHKQLYARKIWHGRHSYTSPNLQSYDSFPFQCGPCDYLSPQTTSVVPDQTKYLSLSASCYYNNGTYTATAGNVVSLGRFTGNLTVSTAFSSSTEPSDVSGYAEKCWNDMANFVDGDHSAIYTNFCNLYSSDYQAAVTLGGGSLTTTNLGGGSYQYAFTINNGGCGIQPFSTIVVNYSTGILTRAQYASSPSACGLCAQYTSSNQEWQYNGVTCNYTLTAQQTGAGCTFITTTETIQGNLSVPYTANQAWLDASASLSQWNISDNSTYPWRTDTSLIAPLTSYDEALSVALGVSNVSYGNSTGDILGAPLPKQYDHFWDALHQNWVSCTYSGNPFWYISTYGAWSDNSYVPKATNWITAYDATQMYYGNWSALTNAGEAPYIWISQYAETKVPRPSLSFARPCGQDRFDINPNSASCITGVSGTTLTVSSTNLITGNKCLVCNTGTVDGVWTISVSGTTITLNSLLVTGSQVQNPQPCFGKTIAKLQWANPPALCGRAYVTLLNNGTSSLDRNTYLVNGDVVYSNNAENLSVTVFSPNQVFLGSNVTASYIYSPYAVDWQWDDNGSKGDYVILNTSYNYRLTGEYSRLLVQSASMANSGCPTPGPTIASPSAYISTCTQSCIANNPCKDPNIYTQPLPYGIMDDIYGSLYLSTCIQSVADPYWYAPLNCNSTSPFTEDDGTCAYTYAHRPLVEARCSPPSGAPIPLATWPDTLSIPIQGGFPSSADPYVYNNEAGCVCNNGVFSTQYINDGVVCSIYAI